MKPVEDWRKAWKWFSVHAMVYAGAIQGAWLQLPDDLKAKVPYSIVSGITIALIVLGVVGRLVKQGKKNAEKQEAE